MGSFVLSLSLLFSCFFSSFWCAESVQQTLFEQDLDESISNILDFVDESSSVGVKRPFFLFARDHLYIPDEIDQVLDEYAIEHGQKEGTSELLSSSPSSASAKIQDSYPTPTASASTEDDKSSTKRLKKRYSKAELFSQRKLPSIHDFTEDELKAIFEGFTDRRDVQHFTRDLLLSKYNADVGYQHSNPANIVWGKVNVFGWPRELRSYSVCDFTKDECIILLKNLHQVHFEMKSDTSGQRSFKGNKALNEALYQELKEACKIHKTLTSGSNVHWQALHRLVPNLVLKTHDHRIWTEQDRELISTLILNDLIPKIERNEIYI